MLGNLSNEITTQLNAEDLLEASINETSTGINQVIDSKMSSLKEDLKEEISKIMQDVKQNILDKLTKENKKLRNRVTVLEDETDHLYDKVYELEKVVHNMNQYGRKNNIEIRGIPDGVTNEELENTTINILNNLVEIPISVTEVEACHRMKGGIEGSKDTILRFNNRKRSDEVKNNNRSKTRSLDLREFGSDKELYINDNLCPYYKLLAYKCRALKRINLIDSVNVQDGLIKILIRGRFYIINHETELMNMFPKIDFIYL